MTFDWHNTQNDDYLNLSKERLTQNKLIWVEQFISIINNFYINNNIDCIKIKDIGCNVGHFYRGIKEINKKCDYYGYDISKTYISVAQNNFPNGKFLCQNIENIKPEITDVTVLSATYEHLNFHKKVLLNIFNSTNSLIIIRTFLGESYKKQKCLKEKALSPYVIKQFTLDYFNSIKPINWTLEVIDDLATNSVEKCVCKDIIRTQKVLIFKRN